MPLDGGMTLLQRQIPFRQAMGMLLTGRRIPAAEALRMGLVNEVVPRAELDAAVGALGRRHPRLRAAVACARSSRWCAAPRISPPPRRRRQRLPALVEALQSAGSREEGVRAFVEKRKPVWQGR